MGGWRDELLQSVFFYCSSLEKDLVILSDKQFHLVRFARGKQINLNNKVRLRLAGQNPFFKVCGYLPNTKWLYAESRKPSVLLYVWCWTEFSHQLKMTAQFVLFSPYNYSSCKNECSVAPNGTLSCWKLSYYCTFHHVCKLLWAYITDHILHMWWWITSCGYRIIVE